MYTSSIINALFPQHSKSGLYHLGEEYEFDVIGFGFHKHPLEIVDLNQKAEPNKQWKSVSFEQVTVCLS